MQRTRAARRTKVATAALWLLAGAAVPGVCAQAPAPSRETSSADTPARQVAGLRVVTESGRVLQENPPELSLRPGAPADAAAIRDTLRELFRTGRYADIRVEETPVEGGVRLDFVVRQNLFFNRVRVEGIGEERVTSRVLASLQLALGEAYTETAVNDALVRIAEALREEGFCEAAVTHEVEKLEETRQANVRIVVRPGRRARIGALTLRNNTAFPDRELLGKSRLRAGRTVNPRRFERGADRLRRFLADKGYLAARVLIRRGEYDAGQRAVPLEIEATAGLRVRVAVEGARVSQKALRELMPIYQEGSVDEDLLQEGRRNLRNYFEREGYFDSAVSYSMGENAESKEQVITYRVERGRRHRLAAIEFRGNRYFSNEILRSVLSIQPASFLERGRFSRRLLAEDADRIQAMYISNGFLGARVQGQVTESHRGKADDLLVSFSIEEGPQTRVGDLRIEGNAVLDTESLLGVSGATPNQPYSESSVTGDRNNILALYFNEGFPEARFEAEAVAAAEANRVNLRYRITEGPQVRVRQVLLDGYQHTRRDVVAREVLLAAEEPLRQGDVVESQRRLYNLGIFSRVQIAPQNPAGTEREKNLVVLVDEARRYTIAYGGGIEFQRLGGAGGDPVAGDFRASPRGLFEISKANFAGRAHTISFKVRASSLQGRALGSYAAPNFWGKSSWNLLLTALADKTRDVRTFTSQRYEGSAQIEHRLSPATSFLYRYAFRRVLVDAGSLQIDPQQIPLFSQPTEISAFSLTWIRDRRDNPAEALRGDFNTVDVSLAGKHIGSSASFFRLFFQNSTYHRVGRRLVFARSARLGLQEPFADTTLNEIPLPERFFAGGGNTLRGFGLNQAGPRDPQTGFPVGGLAMIVLNHELRFPMRLPRLADRVGGAVFYDAGNVFSRVNRITFRLEPRSPSDINYFSHTIGFGVRYGTPIGPVRLDLGYQLNPASFFADDGMGGQRLVRAPRFQFFFNFGSIF
jgi:outer membrane protein assembly complex protein YaeT